MVLIEFAIPGMIAPAATATKPAIKEYSIRSCPRVSVHTRNFRAKFVSFLNPVSFLIPVWGSTGKEALGLIPRLRPLLSLRSPKRIHRMA